MQNITNHLQGKVLCRRLDMIRQCTWLVCNFGYGTVDKICIVYQLIYHNIQKMMNEEQQFVCSDFESMCPTEAQKGATAGPMPRVFSSGASGQVAVCPIMAAIAAVTRQVVTWLWC